MAADQSVARLSTTRAEILRLAKGGQLKSIQQGGQAMIDPGTVFQLKGAKKSKWKTGSI